MPATATLFDIPLTRITGEPATLAEFQGKVLLIVNTASKCGLTPQYAALETLYSTYRHCGFEILGFPTNDFAEQEPGSDADIQAFCATSFHVTFPMFAKSTVTGPHTSELYQWLTSAQPVAQVNDPAFRANIDGFLASVNRGQTNPLPAVLWNFEKFLVDRRGRITARFAPDMLPDDPRVIRAIESALPPLEGALPAHH